VTDSTSGAAPADPPGIDDPPAPVGGLARPTMLALEADVATAVSTFVVAIIVARSLGPTNRGIYFLATLTAATIVLFGNLGMDSAAIVYGAKQLVPARQLHGLAVAFSIAVGLIGTALLVGFEHLWVTTVLKGMTWTTVLLVAASIAPLMYATVVGAMLTGMGHVPAVSVIRIAVAVATPVVTVPAVIIWSGRAVSAVAAWLIVTTFFAVAVGWYSCMRAAPPAWPSREALRRVTSFSLRAYVGTLAAQGFLRIDFFFVSAYLGPRAVGLYAQASGMAERMTTLGQAVYQSSAQRLGADPIKEATELAAALVRLLLLVMVPVAVVLAVVARPLMIILFGARFASAGEPFAILLPGTVCLTLWYVMSLYIMASLHRPGRTTVIQGLGLIVAIPLYWVAIHQWGFNGAAAVSTLVYVAVFLAGVWSLVRSPYVTWHQLIPGRADVRRFLALGRQVVAKVRTRGAPAG
jgi:O-antigen/teichoic acid export membrane protein